MKFEKGDRVIVSAQVGLPQQRGVVLSQSGPETYVVRIDLKEREPHDTDGLTEVVEQLLVLDEAFHFAYITQQLAWAGLELAKMMLPQTDSERIILKGKLMRALNRALIRAEKL